jgi:formylglycine-generating enzyme
MRLMSKSPTLMPFVAALFAAFLSVSRLHAQPLVNIETVMVGDPGNAADTTGYGAVADVFAMGKYEVTIEQYTAFLNAVAATDPYSLYNPRMATDLNIAGITQNGSSGGFSYSVIGSGNRPITYVSWFDAARFANWMHNGATSGASTETGAYTLDGAMSGIITVNPGAKWRLPSEDQWYKAAYYKGGGTNAGYWLYPTESNTAPGNMIGGATNQLNYLDNSARGKMIEGPPSTSVEIPVPILIAGIFSVTQSDTYSATQNYLTDVGVFSNSASAYDTFDQGGNVVEWNDAVIDARSLLFPSAGVHRGLRGGSWIIFFLESLLSGGRDRTTPSGEHSYVGFRVALRAATMTVEHPPGSVLSNDAAASVFLCLVDSQSDARVYTMRNIGGLTLSNIVVTKSGSDSSNFVLTAPTTNSLGPDASTTFSVSFAPTSSGSRSAQLSITSNDSNNSPFVINLSGFGLGEDLDTDGDGLNDAAEFTMSALGFDWQSNQPTLVAALYSNANRAQLFTQLQYDGNRTNGQADVTTNPAAFNLFTQSQFNGNRTAGQQDVIASPMSYGLYDSTSIMDLRMGGLMIQRQGTDATIVFQPQTTTDLATLPFTNNGTPITNTVPMPEDKGFLRVEAIYVPAGDLTTDVQTVDQGTGFSRSSGFTW